MEEYFQAISYTARMYEKTTHIKTKYSVLIYIINGDMFIFLSVCLLLMAGRTAGPIKTKLGIWTHVNAGSVLVKVKVIWCHLANANKTPYRGPQGTREFAR